MFLGTKPNKQKSWIFYNLIYFNIIVKLESMLALGYFLSVSPTKIVFLTTTTMFLAQTPRSLVENTIKDLFVCYHLQLLINISPGWGMGNFPFAEENIIDVK